VERALNTWYDLLRELKSAHGDRFKIYACPLAA
jgi:peroxiredoxin family protein